jgi:hypothetical protein
LKKEAGFESTFRRWRLQLAKEIKASGIEVGKTNMINRIGVTILLFGFVLAGFGCKKLKRGQTTGANLPKAEVLRIAEATAISEGYDIRKYNMTGCHYEFTRKDHSWAVFYELKPPTPPGGHFMVSVDDLTRKATLAHGE